MGTTRAAVLTFMAVGLVAACGTGVAVAEHVFDPVDGVSMAKDIAAKQAERLNARLGYRDRPRDAESIAATEVNAAPGFLIVVSPLIAALFTVYLVLAVVARRAGLPDRLAIPAGAVVVAWPIATTLPLT